MNRPLSALAVAAALLLGACSSPSPAPAPDFPEVDPSDLLAPASQVPPSGPRVLIIDQTKETSFKVDTEGSYNLTKDSQGKSYISFYLNVSNVNHTIVRLTATLSTTGTTSFTCEEKNLKRQNANSLTTAHKEITLPCDGDPSSYQLVTVTITGQ